LKQKWGWLIIANPLKDKWRAILDETGHYWEETLSL
jgi:hypothetical protein